MVGVRRPSIVLKNIVRNQLLTPVSPPFQAVSDMFLKRHEKGLLALVFYGSCLRSSNIFEGIVDLFVVVDDYKTFYKTPVAAISNFILPPNVFYMETPFDGKKVRVKYGVVSMGQLKRATSCLWFHSYFWARFCQPMQLVYHRDERVVEGLVSCICNAFFTFCQRVIPCLESPFDAKELWTKGLSLTYRAELRPEGARRADSIWQGSRVYLESVTPYVLTEIRGKNWLLSRDNESKKYRVNIKGSRFFACCLPWATRIALGKVLSVLRLTKAAYTFRGGVDYALWKIERHTGIHIELSPFLRRHPILAMIFSSWRLLVKGAIK